MRELKVIVAGSSSGYQKAVDEAVAITKNAAKQIGEAESAILYKQTNQYVSLWNDAVRERERLETLSRKRRLSADEAAALELARFNEKVQAERLIRTAADQKAAYAAIAAGSVPANMAGAAAASAAQRAAIQNATGKAESAGLNILESAAGAAGGGYLLNKSGQVVGKFKGANDLEKAIETAAKGVNELGHAGHASSRMMFEGQVLLHEAFAGNYRKMMSSAMIFMRLAGQNLLKYTGISYVANAVSKIPGVGFLTKNPVTNKLLPGIGTVLDVLTIGATVREFFRMEKARGEAKETGKALNDRNSDTAGELRSRVEGLRRLGKISDKDASRYLRQLKNGSYEDISSVLNATNPLMKSGTVEQQQKAAQYAERLAKAKDKLKSEEFASMDNQNKLLQLLRDERDLREQIADAKKRGDMATATELQADLLGKQSDEKSVRAAMNEEFDKKHKQPWMSKAFTRETDNLSKMGLFTASGLLLNSQLDISKHQLTALQSMEKNIRTIASRPEIWN